MHQPRSGIHLRRDLGRRLLPLSVAVAFLISVGFPALYYVVASAGLRNVASLHAQGLAARVQVLVRDAPGRWKSQTVKLGEILRDPPPGEAITLVRVLDEGGHPLAQSGSEPTRTGKWWANDTLAGSAPITLNNRKVGTVHVWTSPRSLLTTTLRIFLLSALLGVCLGVLMSSYPLGVAAEVEGRVRMLAETVHRANAETEQLQAKLESKVEERTTRLAERGRQLDDAKAFLEHLVDASPGLIWLGNPADFSLSYVSPNVERILGYAPQSILTLPGFWLNHIHPDHRDQFLTEHRRAVEGRQEPFEYEVPFLHENGTYRWLFCAERYEYDDARSPVRVLGYALDVSERREAEQGIRQAKEEAERANRSKSEFLSRMSHELRTPLNAILGFAQLLEMDSVDPQQRESVERILKGGQHLLTLINEVLDIARIETGRLTVSLEPVPLGQVMQESLALIAPVAAGQNLELMVDEVKDIDWHVMADRQRLKQVILNLLTNAVKYNREGGAIALSCEEVLDGRLRIKVSDTGTGIPSDKLDRLFIPFSRLTVGHAGVDGTGIGLALSKGLVELMGGGIGVESQLGQGSTFWVELALAQPVPNVYQHGRVETRVPDTQQPRPTRTVLYIEDNLSNLELIQRILANRPEIKLLWAMQGRLGLDLASQHRPDLILLDMNLPDIPGEEVLRRLRDMPETRWLPVVVISADATQERIDGALAVGARAYLTKPLDIRRLLELMDETLNQTASA